MFAKKQFAGLMAGLLTCLAAGSAQAKFWPGVGSCWQGTASGPDVTDIEVGDRVVYGPVLGACAKHRNAPTARLIKIPDNVSDEVAAAVLMKGMTVEYLKCRAYPVKAGEHVLFHAASGGVGHMAGQWGKHLGARMIGVTSGANNCRTILNHGYSDAIDRNSENIAERVRDLTDSTLLIP